MPRRYRPMNIEMQKEFLRSNLRRLNHSMSGDLPRGPHHLEEEWEDYLDDEASLPENIEILEEYFPTVRWRKPMETHPRINPNKPTRWKMERRHAGPKSDSYLLRASVVVQPHKVKAKNKTYTLGRIQLTLDGEFIGRRAKVSVLIPGACPLQKLSKPVEPRFIRRSDRREHFKP